LGELLQVEITRNLPDFSEEIERLEVPLAVELLTSDDLDDSRGAEKRVSRAQFPSIVF
jgi:hypothetical protein